MHRCIAFWGQLPCHEVDVFSCCTLVLPMTAVSVIVSLHVGILLTASGMQMG